MADENEKQQVQGEQSEVPVSEQQDQDEESAADEAENLIRNPEPILQKL